MCRNRFSLLAAACLLLAGLACAAAQSSESSPASSAAPSSRPELRAFWVDGFNDGFHTPSECDQLMARVRAAHMNAVFVQMRKRSDAYYQSRYEPWATDDPQHFDSLAYLLKLARAPGQPRIQVHAWINTTTVGSPKRMSWIVQQHPEWLSLSDTGENFDHETYKIDPGNPTAADFTFRIVMDIVRSYDVDGVHLDFIRYGGDNKTAGHWGYNSESIARYNARYGTTGQPAWNDKRWQEWRRQQVAALVRRVYAGATALRPHIVVSAATICWGDGPLDDAGYEAKSAAYTEVYASWRDWLKEGILDLNCPMTYVTQAKHPTFWAHWSTFVKDHQYDRPSSMGIGNWENSIADSLAQIRSTRDATPAGNVAAGAVLFSYDGTDTAAGKEIEYNPAFYDALSGPDVFPSDVPVPAIPWKEHPVTGGIMGVLLEGQGIKPLDSAEIYAENQATRQRATATTDANGFYAFVKLPAGAYNIGLASDGSVIGQANVTPGGFAACNAIEAAEQPRKVAGIGALADGTPVVIAPAFVTNGSNRLGDRFYAADNPQGPVVRVEIAGLTPPTVYGDKVAISGTLTHENGAAVIKASTVRLVGIDR